MNIAFAFGSACRIGCLVCAAYVSKPLTDCMQSKTFCLLCEHTQRMSTLFFAQAVLVQTLPKQLKAALTFVAAAICASTS